MSHTHISQSTSRRDLADSLRGARPRKQGRLRHWLLPTEHLEDHRLLAGSPWDSIPAWHRKDCHSVSAGCAAGEWYFCMRANITCRTVPQFRSRMSPMK
jgi:hypothetical protein